MPRIDYDDIRNPNLWLPSRFERAVEGFQDGMMALQSEGIVEGAFMHGTAYPDPDVPTSKSEATSRSDLDVIIITREKGSDMLFALRAVALDIYRETSVELEASFFTRAQLAEGDHNLDGSFGAWAQRRFATGSENNPLTAPLRDIVVRPLETLRNNYPGEHDLNRFFGQRFGHERDFLRGPFYSMSETFSYMSKRHFDIGRKVVDHLDFMGFLPPDLTHPSLKRSDVATTVRRLLVPYDATLGEMYDQMADEDALYTELINEVAEGKVTPDQYEQILYESILDKFPRVIEMTERFRDAYRQYCLGVSLVRGYLDGKDDVPYYTGSSDIL